MDKTMPKDDVACVERQPSVDRGDLPRRPTSPSIGLRRTDTPENREFWEYVARAVEEWETVKPEWARRLEGK